MYRGTGLVMSAHASRVPGILIDAFYAPSHGILVHHLMKETLLSPLRKCRN